MAARWYFDTSVFVAAAVSKHPHNARAIDALAQMVQRRHQGYMSGHSLTELYSVLTRTPFRPPIHAAEAWRIIEATFLPHFEMVTLSATEYSDLTRHCALEGWTGGRIHDVAHLRCAVKKQCDRIYTFNVKDFQQLAPPELAEKICAP